MTAPVLVTKEEDDTHEKRTATQPSDADASSVDLVKEGQTEAEKKSSMMTMQFVLNQIVLCRPKENKLKN